MSFLPRLRSTRFPALIGLGLLLFCTAPARAQVFTRLTTANAPGNPIVTDPGADVTAYTGASWIDFDQDGWTDLFVNRRALYRNNAGGSFTKWSTGPQGDGLSFGNTWADFDNDGDLDVVLSGPTPAALTGGRGSFLFRNDGGTFVKVVSGDFADSLGNAGWGSAFADYDLDGDVDFVIAAPIGFTGTNPNRLFHNRGDGTFERDLSTDVTDATDTYTCPSWSDFDFDGDPDLSIGAGPVDGTTDLDFLYRNRKREGGSPILQHYALSPPATDPRDGQLWNWIDYDDDGDLDLYITNYGALSPLANDLYRNQAGTYVKQTAGQAGPIVSDLAKSLASVWGDFDNDGWLDCLVTNDATATDRFYHNNRDGTFSAMSFTGVTTEAGPHYGACAGDYDKDGDLDLFVNGTTTRKALYRNDLGHTSHWVELALRGTASNRAAIGARVRIKAAVQGIPVWQLREVSAQNSFNGSNDLTLHFGLGTATAIESLVVEWPSGLREAATVWPIDSNKILVEGSLSPTPALPTLIGSYADRDGVHLSWRVDGYEGGAVIVERRAPDQDWTAVAQVDVDGTRSAFYLDADVSPGARYGYRIVIEEADRRILSGETWVELPARTMAFVGPRPNPARTGTGLSFWCDLSALAPARLEIFDVAGRRVGEASIESPPGGLQAVMLPRSVVLHEGLYFGRLTQSGHVALGSFVVLR